MSVFFYVSQLSILVMKHPTQTDLEEERITVARGFGPWSAGLAALGAR